MTFNSTFFRKLTLTSYFLLIVWLVVWHFFLTIDKNTSTIFTLLFWIMPILLPAKGLIQGKPYTHAWANFIIMYYLLHGLTAVYAVEGERLYATYYWFGLPQLDSAFDNFAIFVCFAVPENFDVLFQVRVCLFTVC